MRYKFIFLIIAIFIMRNGLFAQQIFTLKGVISKKLTIERVPQVVITDLKSHEIMMSDELGWFSIKVTIGDTILFTKTDYTDQKIVVTGTADIPVYMQPVIKLKEVSVVGISKKQEMNQVMKEYHSEGTFYNGKPPVLSFLSSPLTGLYELFGKTPQEAKRFAKYSKDEIEYAEVKRRYNVKFVKQVTNSNDSLVRKFMDFYTPTFEDLKAWNDYELIRQTKKSYEYYLKNKDKFDLENINAPQLIKPTTGTH